MSHIGIPTSMAWKQAPQQLHTSWGQDDRARIVDARSAFDAFQDRRAIEGDFETKFAYQAADCVREPALGSGDLMTPQEYAGTQIAPPRCWALTPADLAWQRKEQIWSSGRAASTVTGPVAEAFVADPSLGWSDALKAVAEGKARPVRLASGVSWAATGAHAALLKSTQPLGAAPVNVRV